MSNQTGIGVNGPSTGATVETVRQFRANNSVKILGIDPGTATVGYGVLDYLGRGAGKEFEFVTAGVIKTPKDMAAGKRLGIIRSDLLSLIDEYTPDVVVVEAIFFFKNAKTLVPVSQARGVILEAAASKDIETHEYTPMQVKLNIAGHGKAEKRDVQIAVARLLQLEDLIRPDDASDALALAVCHARMSLSIVR